MSAEILSISPQKVTQMDFLQEGTRLNDVMFHKYKNQRFPLYLYKGVNNLHVHSYNLNQIISPYADTTFH